MDIETTYLIEVFILRKPIVMDIGAEHLRESDQMLEIEQPAKVITVRLAIEPKGFKTTGGLTSEEQTINVETHMVVLT